MRPLHFGKPQSHFSDFAGETVSAPCTSRSEYSCTSSSGTPSVPRMMRHRAVLQNAQDFQRSAIQIQNSWRQAAAAKNPAMTRLIFAEARKRHQARTTFQTRLKEQGEKSGPTLWKLKQCKQILHEALHDVLAAVKVCSLASKVMSGGKDQTSGKS